MFEKLNYCECKSFNEAFNILENNKNCCIIAGGTDVIIGIRNNSSRFRDVGTILDLRNVPNIRGIYEENDKFIIGSYTSFSEILDNDNLKNYFPLLTEAVSKIGNLQVRNRATIGGNIVNCAPCADSVPPLLVYDAKVIIKNKLDSYEMPLSEFLVAPYKTKLLKNEILDKIIIPKPKKQYKGKFVKLGKRKGVAISRLTLALLVYVNNNQLSEIKIASGAITPIATRFFEIEDKFKNMIISEDNIISFVSEIANTILHITGLRWSYPYKLPVFQQLLFNEINKLIL